MKRYCQTLELVDDPALIEKYWPEGLLAHMVTVSHALFSGTLATGF